VFGSAAERGVRIGQIIGPNLQTSVPEAASKGHFPFASAIGVFKFHYDSFSNG
jgi:hypothetical protein